MQNPDEPIADLDEQLSGVKAATLETGTYLGEVDSIRPNTDNDRIIVTIKLPSGSTFEQSFEYPEPWEEKYDFVRWIGDNGHGPVDSQEGDVSIRSMEEEEVECEKDGDNWALVVPEQEKEGLMHRIQPQPRFMAEIAAIGLTALIASGTITITIAKLVTLGQILLIIVGAIASMSLIAPATHY